MGDRVMSKEPALPNFLGIGAQRSGTSWVYINLKLHPQVWLPPLKELHYFDKPAQIKITDRLYRTQFLRRIRDHAYALIKQDKITLTEISWDLKYFFGKRNNNWYASLFQPQSGQTAGEITPAYMTLETSVVKEIQRINPQLKIFFFMRDPIERSWSSAVKSLARDKNRAVSAIPKENFIHIFESESAALRSDYIRALNIWEDVFNKSQVHIDYMDEIQNNPRDVLLRLYRFLEISDDERYIPSEANKKINTTDGYKTEMPSWAQIYLARQHLPQLEILSKRFGGHATNWLRRARSILSN
jgi:hypothetical protein